MSEDSEMTATPSEEVPPEILVEQLEKAAEGWDAKAEAETQAADGTVASEMLYRATADAMRHAKQSVEEKNAAVEPPPE